MPRRRSSTSSRAAQGSPRAEVRTDWLCLVIVLAVLAVFGRVVRHDFVTWDDDGHITENPHLDTVSWNSLVRFWKGPYFSHYVPVSYSLFTAEAWLAQSGRDESGKLLFRPELFHTVSVLLHAACAMLVFRLLLQIGNHPWGAFAGALLFAVHPLQVESVAWISEQRGLLSGVFSLLAISSYLKFGAGVNRQPLASLQAFQLPAVHGATGGIGCYVFATSACLLAILAKPSGVAVPLMAAVIDLFLLRRSWRVSLAALAPWAMMAAGMLVVTSREQPAAAMSYVAPLWARPLIAGDALQFYLTKVVWPWELMIQYPRAPREVLAGAWVYFAWLVPTLVLAACLYWRKTGPWLVCAGWFVAVLAPVLGLLPFYYQHYSTVADRYAYLALFAPALAAAWWFSRDASQLRVMLSAAVLLALGCLSFVQAGHWLDSQTLFSRTLAVNPRSDAAHANLGAELLRRGQYEEALVHIDEARRLNPDNDTEKVSLNRGLTLLNLGRVDEAIEAYEATLDRFPQCHLAHLNLCAAYFQKQDWEKTIEHSRAGLSADPQNFPARFNLALALERKGQAEEAIAELRTLLDYWPNQFEAHMKLASLLLEQGEAGEAVEHLAAGVQARPEEPSARFDYALGLAAAGQNEQAVSQLRLLLRQATSDWPLVASHTAWLLATREVKNKSDALPLAEAACRQTQFKVSLPLRVLAAAQAAAGKFQEADRTATEAARLAASEKEEALVKALQSDVACYREGRAIEDSRPLSP